MPLQKQNASFPMARGVDTKTDPKQLVTGVMEELENAQFNSPGRFKKRFGYESLAQVENPNALGVLGDNLVAFANNKIQTYSPGSGAFISAKIASSPTTEANFQGMQLSIDRGITNFESFIACDSAYHASGRQAFVGYGASQNSYFSIVDYETNAILYGPVSYLSGATSLCKVFAVSGYFIVIYFESTSLKYIAVPVNTTTGAIPSAVTIASNLPASNRTVDGCVLNDSLYVVWGLNGTSIGAASIDSALTVRTATVITNDTVTEALAIAADETLGVLSISYYDGTNVMYLQTDTLFNITLNKAIVEVVANVVGITLIVDNNAGYTYYEVSASSLPSGTYFNHHIRRATITAGVNGTGASWIRSVGIVSRPFKVTVNDEVVTCIMAGYTGSQPAVGQGTVFILNTTGVVIGKLSPGNCYGISAGSKTAADSNSPPQVTMIDESSFVTSFLRADFGYSESGTQYSGYGVYGVTFNFDSSANYQNVVAANNLHAIGGVLCMYDGQQFVEHGFNILPEPVQSATVSYDGSTQNFPDDGTFSYYIVFEWVDAQGNYHQSSPSTVFNKAVTAPQTSIILVVPTLRLTQKDKVFLSVFRNTLDEPTVFNRILSTPSTTQQNTLAANTITVTDSTPDTTIVGHQLLYTTGGVVPNYAVPSPKIVAGYKNRVIVIPSETPNIAWISKNILQGIPGIPVEFSAFFTIQVNTLGGDISAFSQMDDKGVFFKESSIFYMVGDGPADNGSNNDISVPQQIPTDAGCTNQRSVLLMHDGIMYQSGNDGIYLLDRALQVSYIGAPVEAYNASTVISSQIIPNSTQVRFQLDTGEALVYDYLVKQWSVFTNHDAIDAIIYDGAYTYLGTNGKALKETSGFSDDGQFIKLKLKTGWLSFSGIQGFQRIFRMMMLGNFYNAHKILVSLAYDFNPNPAQTVLIDVASLFDNGVYGEGATYGADSPYGGDAGYPLEQFTIYPTIQKCEALQVTIEDVQYESVIGESYDISSLAFEVGVLGGLQRQRATKKFG